MRLDKTEKMSKNGYSSLTIIYNTKLVAKVTFYNS
jgi:hypothetical protein